MYTERANTAPRRCSRERDVLPAHCTPRWLHDAFHRTYVLNARIRCQCPEFEPRLFSELGGQVFLFLGYSLPDVDAERMGTYPAAVNSPCR